MRFQHNPFTDKLDICSIGPNSTTADYLTGNDGILVPSDSGFNINVLGENTTGLNTTGDAASHTLTIHGLASSTTQVGTTRYATNAEAAAQSLSTAALTPSNITSIFSSNPLPASQGGTGLSSPAAHSLLVTNGSSAFTILGTAGNGQIPIGSIGSDPVLATITSGTGISITNGPGTITISATGTSTLNYTAVNHAASPYTAQATDDYLGVNTLAGVVSILLPNAPATGRAFIVKDSNGNSATSAITITTVGGVVTIDGSNSYTINTNYEAVQLIFNGTSYEVF